MDELSFYEDLLNLEGFKITSIDKKPTKIIFEGEYHKSVSKCPNCGEPTGVIHQRQLRKYQDLNISGKEVWLLVKIPQFFCPTCHRYFYDHPNWVVSGKLYTQRQSKWVFEMCEKQPFSQVGILCNMHTRTVQNLYYEIAEKKVKTAERYKNVRKLGIDEISRRKGKAGYCCVLTDLERGTQIDILSDRKKETLVAHFKSLGVDFCNQIIAIACDIWKGYINAAKECFPNCYVVIDRFHVVKSLNEVLDSKRKFLRKSKAKEACFKHLKWSLFKRNDKCTDKEKKALKLAFEQSPELEKIYELREQFNTSFDVAKSQKELEISLNDWGEKAKNIEYKPLNKFLKTLNNWKTEISNFGIENLSNAITEGLNNGIRYMQRISCGITNFQNLRVRVLVASV